MVKKKFLPVLIITCIAIYYRAETNPQDCLKTAIMHDSPEEIDQAMLTGADINKKIAGIEPVLMAVMLKKNGALECMLKLGCDAKISHQGRSLAHIAAMADDPKSATLLIKYGAGFRGNIDQTKNMMDYAIWGSLYGRERLCYSELIQELINQGWDIAYNTHGYNGCCSLNEKITNVWWDAIQPYHGTETIKLLLKNKANPNQIIYNNGFKGASWTPLLLAIEKNNNEAVKILIEAGANVNQSALPRWFTIERHTPLSYALRVGNTQAVELLISYGSTL